MSSIHKFVDRTYLWWKVVCVLGQEHSQGQWREDEDIFETPSYRVYGDAHDGSTIFTILKKRIAS
jgi:hypothetical protein